jgi:hypothetical protein
LLIYYGSATGPGATPTTVLAPTGVSTGWPGAVASAGDVNGDGYSDVVVGDNGASPSVSAAGLIEVYLGGLSGLVTTPATTINGTTTNQSLGTSVAGLGDFNGDGYPDIVGGAEAHGTGGINGAYVYLGTSAATGVTGVSTSSTTGGYYARGSILNTNAGTSFAASIAGAGDLNGDGLMDVIVGCPSCQEPSSSNCVTNCTGAGGGPPCHTTCPAGGVIYIYDGFSGGAGMTGISAAGSDIDSPHDTDGDRFGASVAGPGDINGDGLADVIIGSPGITTAYYWQGVTGSGGLSLAPQAAPTGDAATNFGTWVASIGGGSHRGATMLADALFGLDAHWPAGREIRAFAMRERPWSFAGFAAPARATRGFDWQRRVN